MLKRPRLEEVISTALSRGPAVALLGPRQCGKTTLARAIMRRHAECLRLDALNVVYPGTRTYPLDDRITAVGAETLAR